MFRPRLTTPKHSPRPTAWLATTLTAVSALPFAPAHAFADPPVRAATAAPRFDVSTAMRFGGTVDAERAVPLLRAQIGPLQRCAVLVRRHDRVVGSLNVQLTVEPNGTVRPQLQSPVGAAGHACLVTAMQRWRLAGLGSGTLMVLLTISGASG